jgi:uncharacterized protein
MNAKALSAAEIIDLLGLAQHPEGGHFRETFRDEARIFGITSALSTTSRERQGIGQLSDRTPNEEIGRAASTAIYFMLARGERSHWHRVDAVEIWHYYAGAPLELAITKGESDPTTRVRLGNDLAAGERPQAVVPAEVWQSAATLGDWTLAGCTVAPGFEFSGFEIAPAGWKP